MKKVVTLTENDIKDIIYESIGHIYTEQWADETREFMNGLENGEAIVEDDIVYVQVMKRMTPENDPRYVYFKRGDDKLHDDHFCMQDSPKLSSSEIRAINRYAGWDDEVFDIEY